MGSAKRIAVVGGGAAGVFCAYQLRRALPNCELHLFERERRIGGNVRDLVVDHFGTEVTVDAGAQFFHGYPQPGYVALCKELGFEPALVRAPVGLTLWDRGSARPRLFLPTTLDGFRCYSRKDWQRLVYFVQYLVCGLHMEKSDLSWEVSLDEWLASLALIPQSFREEVVRPFNYQFVSLPLARMGEASARYTLSYFLRKVAGPLRRADRVVNIEQDSPRAPAFATMETLQHLGGLEAVLHSALARADAHRHLGEPVMNLEETSARTTRVRTAVGALDVDHVVLACEPPAAYRILRGSGHPALNALAGLEYMSLPIAITRGTNPLMPPPPYRQPINTTIDGEKLAFTVWFDPMRPLRKKPLAVFKSWGTPALPSLRGEIFRHEHRVLLPTTTAMRCRSEVMRHQGYRRIWFAGGWTQWFDSQESAWRSAVDMTAALTRQPRPVEQSVPSVGRLHSWLQNLAKHAPAPMRRFVASAVDRVVES